MVSKVSLNRRATKIRHFLLKIWCKICRNQSNLVGPFVSFLLTGCVAVHSSKYYFVRCACKSLLLLGTKLMSHWIELFISFVPFYRDFSLTNIHNACVTVTDTVSVWNELLLILKYKYLFFSCDLFPSVYFIFHVIHFFHYSIYPNKTRQNENKFQAQLIKPIFLSNRLPFLPTHEVNLRPLSYKHIK